MASNVKDGYHVFKNSSNSIKYCLKWVEKNTQKEISFLFPFRTWCLKIKI
jgi:hypothetical protein